MQRGGEGAKEEHFNLQHLQKFLSSKGGPCHDSSVPYLSRLALCNTHFSSVYRIRRKRRKGSFSHSINEITLIE